MFCGKCGTKIKDGDSFCTNCGAPVDNASAKNTDNEFDIDFGDSESDTSDLSYQINNAKCVNDYIDDTSVEEMDTIKFGSYPQSDKSGEIKEPIKWIVLDKKDGKALLLSKYVLDKKCYHNTRADITWEECDLRKWLNDDFFTKSFTETEKNKILISELYNEDSASMFYYKDGGNNTNDKVFCLSLNECYSYFGEPIKEDSNYYNKRLGTCDLKGAQNRKLWKIDIAEKWYSCNEDFWTRTKGCGDDDRIAYVDSYGIVYDGYGYPSTEVDNKGIGVRPAIWVKY